MLTLLKTFFHDLLFSPEAAKGYLRGLSHFVALLAATAGTVFTTLPQDQLEALLGQPKKLAILALPSVLAGFAGMVRAGDKTPPEVKAMVEREKNGG